MQHELGESFKFGYGESMLQQTAVQQVAQLGFAYGNVGQRYPLITDENRAEFAQECAEHTLPLTITNTAYCGDERETIALADGTNDPEVLKARIVAQLFGGITLAATKATVAANAAIVKDAANIWQAFMTIDEHLASLGYEGAGHAECGANAGVESSVAQAVQLDMLAPAVGLLVPDDGHNHDHLQGIASHKHQLLENGFYGTWKPGNFDDYMSSKYPQHYSYLKTDPNDHATHGHNGSGLYVVTQEGMGYQKTGRAFSVTQHLMQTLAHQLGGSTEERRRILLSFVDDTVQVGAGIVAGAHPEEDYEGFPVFAQAA